MEKTTGNKLTVSDAYYPYAEIISHITGTGIKQIDMIVLQRLRDKFEVKKKA
jgi:hypothetical protein